MPFVRDVTAHFPVINREIGGFEKIFHHLLRPDTMLLGAVNNEAFMFLYKVTPAMGEADGVIENDNEK